MTALLGCLSRGEEQGHLFHSPLQLNSLSAPVPGTTMDPAPAVGLGEEIKEMDDIHSSEKIRAPPACRALLTRAPSKRKGL